MTPEQNSNCFLLTGTVKQTAENEEVVSKSLFEWWHFSVCSKVVKDPVKVENRTSFLVYLVIYFIICHPTFQRFSTGTCDIKLNIHHINRKRTLKPKTLKGMIMTWPDMPVPLTIYYRHLLFTFSPLRSIVLNYVFLCRRSLITRSDHFNLV